MNSAAHSQGDLHATQIGEQGSWVVFCHGVFGQGKNFTQIARALGEQHRCLLLDMPQHGRSPWSPTFGYVAMADAVRSASLTPAVVLGRADVGALVAGRRADVVVVDQELSPHGVLRAGRWVVDRV